MLSALIPFANHIGTVGTASKNWFQVGAKTEGQLVATGASVEIRLLTPQPLPESSAALSYWVGLPLPNNAFIQVGYIIWQEPFARWFWEYFPPGTTSKGIDPGFLGQVGGAIAPNGTWIKFVVASTGTAWSAYVNGQKVGSVDLGIRDSKGLTPYAVAEVAGTTRTSNALGPVEFRNLTYRDTGGIWRIAPVGKAYIGNVPSASNHYGVKGLPGEDNHWLAGSDLPVDESYLWPRYHVTVCVHYGRQLQRTRVRD